MSERRWKFAWAYADANGEQIVGEGQPWGAIGWQRTTNGTARPAWVTIAHPAHSVRVAHYHQLFWQRRIYSLSGIPWSGGGRSLRHVAIAAAGGVLALAGIEVSYVLNVVPGPWDTITLAISAGAAGSSGVAGFFRRRTKLYKTLTADDVGPGELDALPRLWSALAIDATYVHHPALVRLRKALWSGSLSEYLEHECRAALGVTPAEIDREQSATPEPPATAEPTQIPRPSDLEPHDASEGDRLHRVWSEAVARHDAIRDEWATYQIDIDKILALPTLADVTEQHTAEFITQLGQADDLARDTQPQTAAAVERYSAATRAAETAWQQAKAHAERIFLSRFSPGERNQIQKIQRLMRQALSSGATPQERQSYYHHAMKLLEQLDHPIAIPKRATMAIESQLRIELGSQSSSKSLHTWPATGPGVTRQTPTTRSGSR